jgi:hypothetical protein
MGQHPHQGQLFVIELMVGKGPLILSAHWQSNDQPTEQAECSSGD